MINSFKVRKFKSMDQCKCHTNIFAIHFTSFMDKNLNRRIEFFFFLAQKIVVHAKE